MKMSKELNEKIDKRLNQQLDRWQIAAMRRTLKIGFRRSSKGVRQKLDKILTDQFLKENLPAFLADSDAMVDKIIGLLREERKS